MTPPEERALRLLSLDGGGIRGLSELLIIKEIMHRLRKEENDERRRQGKGLLSGIPKPCEWFDLIGGTSTGGIIALLLGRLRMDVDTAIVCYHQLAKDIFSKPKRWGQNAVFSATKLEVAIKSIVKEQLGDSEALLLEHGNDASCRTFVCSKNAHDMNIPVLLRTYESYETPVDCKIWEAARATSAAPTFFKSILIGRGQPYVDGGLGLNNPSLLLLEEAHALFPSRKIGCLLSIGAGQPKPIGIVGLGRFQRVFPADVVTALTAIATNCDEAHQDMYKRFANLRNVYFRLSVNRGMEDIELSEWEKLSKVEAHTMQYMMDGPVRELLSVLVDKVRVPRGEIAVGQIVAPHPPPSERAQRLDDTKIRRLPHPVSSFTGRKEILEKIHKYFSSETQSQHIFILHGLGGAGKTQLALKYLAESTSFSDVFYVDATNEQTIIPSLTAITPENIEKSIDASLEWLAGRPDWNWLLFFDNADDVQLNLGRFFPKCRHGNILITTRNAQLCCYAVDDDSEVRVTGMSLDDAKQLLFRLTGKGRTQENEELVQNIVEELHNLALVIAQAGAYIRSHPVSLRRYMELFRDQQDNLMQLEEVQGNDRATYATWKLSYDKLDEPAKAFLQVCSLLHHDGISEEMFKRASLSSQNVEDPEFGCEIDRLLKLFGKRDSGWDTWVFQQTVIDPLASLSLIEYFDHDNSFGLHPLVQHWAHITLGEECNTWLKAVLSIVGLSVDNDEDHYIYQHTLLRHVLHTGMLVAPQGVDAKVAISLANVYTAHGYWKEAEALQVVVMEKRKGEFGDDHLQTLASIEHLALTYQNQCRWQEAETLQLVVMEKRKQQLGDDHDTLISINNLALTYQNQGHWTEAETLHLVVMEKMKQKFGDAHPHTLTSMDNLALTFQNQCRWQEAEALQLVVMGEMRQKFGDDHPHTLTSIAKLAFTYQNQGRWQEAEAFQVVVMEKLKQKLGDSHPHTLISMNNLALTCWNLGQWKKAEALHAAVMEKRKQKLGDDHPDTLISMNNLALTYRDQGQWEKAQTLHMAVTEKMKRKLGDEHLHTLTNMENLAHTYQNQGRWQDAETLQAVVVDKMRQKLGDSNPDTITSMQNLAVIYHEQGRHEDAERLEAVVREKRIK